MMSIGKHMKKFLKKKKRSKTKKSNIKLSTNLSNSNIVNHYISVMNLRKYSELCGSLLIMLSFFLFLIPIKNEDCLNKIKGIVISFASIIFITYILINHILAEDIYNYQKKYESLSPEDKIILDNNEVLNSLIEYLKTGDKALTKAALGILGLYFQIYNLYSGLDYFVDEWNKFVYIFLMLVIFILGLFLYSKSNERLILLGIFQHIQNSKREDIDMGDKRKDKKTDDANVSNNASNFQEKKKIYKRDIIQIVVILYMVLSVIYTFTYFNCKQGISQNSILILLYVLLSYFVYVLLKKENKHLLFVCKDHEELKIDVKVKNQISKLSKNVSNRSFVAKQTFILTIIVLATKLLTFANNIIRIDTEIKLETFKKILKLPNFVKLFVVFIMILFLMINIRIAIIYYLKANDLFYMEEDKDKELKKPEMKLKSTDNSEKEENCEENKSQKEDHYTNSKKEQIDNNSQQEENTECITED